MVTDKSKPSQFMHLCETKEYYGISFSNAQNPIQYGAQLLLRIGADSS
jgi:hypothetical protein